MSEEARGGWAVLDLKPLPEIEERWSSLISRFQRLPRIVTERRRIIGSSIPAEGILENPSYEKSIQQS
jgi:hypothetical protein